MGSSHDFTIETTKLVYKKAKKSSKSSKRTFLGYFKKKVKLILDFRPKFTFSTFRIVKNGFLACDFVAEIARLDYQKCQNRFKIVKSLFDSYF